MNEEMNADTDDTENSADKQIHATIEFEELLYALKRDATGDSADWIVKVPRDGGEASTKIDGAGYYPNPSTAPIHVNFQEFINPDWIQPPTMATFYPEEVPDVPDNKSEWSTDDRDNAYDQLDEARDIWREEVKGRVLGDNTVEWLTIERDKQYPDITIEVVDE
jgi:hypothetical protein